MKYKKLTKYLTPIFETPDGACSWFGYYNYDPLSKDNSKMLCHRTEKDACQITGDMKVEVGYYDIPSGDWHVVGESDSFNWPQGSMLQWLPGDDKSIIFNTSRNNHHIAKLVNIETGESRELNWAIYGLTPDGKKSITIDMDRAHWTRGYHYESVVKPELDVPVLENDGIFEVDIEHNTKRLLIPIEKIIQTDYDNSFKDAKHWIEHIMISPSGKKFCFLHRFSPVSNYLKYTTRLCIADINGENIQVISGWRKFNWSHFGWCGDNAFSIYTYEREKLYDGKQMIAEAPAVSSKIKSFRKIVRRITHSIIPDSIKQVLRNTIRGQRSYYQYYCAENGTFHLVDSIKLKDFDIDGHQNFTNDGKYMITDSYPDKRSFQRLIVYNTEKKRSLVVGRLFAALNHMPGSCDLHPKLSHDNKYLMVDTAYDGRHHMILYNINWQDIKKCI